ncbi:MAG: histidine phosphatase family protein [Planctomycetaceae bacterium]
MYTAFVVRPGETDFDRDQRIQGALDLPLNAAGWKQVNQVIEQLRSEEVDVVYTSPSQPARATAELIADALDISVKELPGLANMNQGLWQGMLMSDLKRKHPRVFKQWADSPESVCPPSGETCEAVVRRVEKALRRPMKRGGRFAVVASDPIAQLAGSILAGSTDRNPGPPAGSTRVGSCEAIETQDTEIPSIFDSTDLIGY